MNDDEAKAMADYLRHGYFMRTGYLGLRSTRRFEESELQSSLSERLDKLTCDLAMADYETVADYIEDNPPDAEAFYTRAYHRREEGAVHACSFRSYAIHSPAQRRKKMTWYCNGGDIREVRGSPSMIKWLGVSNEQMKELQEIFAAYTKGMPIGFEPIAPSEAHALTYKELSTWIKKARWQVFTPEQHALWKRMGEEDGPPPDPPVLSSSEIASRSELEALSPVFKAVRTHLSSDLSAEQNESFGEFSDIVRTAIPWIKQFEYPALFYPKDPGFADEDPMGKTMEEAMFQADQFVLLKILTAQQYDQLVPGVVGEREEFPRQKYPTAG